MVPPCLPLLCFNNTLSSPCLRVIFPQKPNLKWQTLSLQNPEDPLLLSLFQTVTFGMGILFLTHSHSELKPFLCYPVFYYKQLVHSPTCLLVYLSTNLCSSVTLSFITINLFTRPPVYLSACLLTCVLLLPCLLLQSTCSLVHLVHSSTHITTYIFLGIGFFVLYLCIVIRNEGMTNGVLITK